MTSMVEIGRLFTRSFCQKCLLDQSKLTGYSTKISMTEKHFIILKFLCFKSRDILKKYYIHGQFRLIKMYIYL
jgi:hypothetical protein